VDVFVHSDTDEPVRFWGVNGPPRDLSGAPPKICARMLAKRGVNPVRVNGGLFNADGQVAPVKVAHAFRSEAPLYFAVYGALQHSDAIGHFALDGNSWVVEPGYWMQPCRGL
jgi:hypothetical protein